MLLPIGGAPGVTNSSSLPGLQLQGGPTFYVSNQLLARNSLTVSWSADQSGAYEIRSLATSCDTGTVVQNGTYTAGATVSYSVSAISSAPGATPMMICLQTPSGMLNTPFYVARDDSPPTVVVSPGTGAYGVSPNVVASCTDVGGAGCNVIAHNVGANPVMDVDGNISLGQPYQSAIQPPDPTGPAGREYFFQAVDRAGNRSPVLAQKYFVDSSFPVVTSTANDPPTWPTVRATGTFIPRFKVNHAGTAYLQIGGNDCSDGTQIGSSLPVAPANPASIRGFGSKDIGAILSPGANTLRICFKNTSNIWGYTTIILQRDTVIPTVTSVLVGGGAAAIAPNNATLLVNTSEPVGMMVENSRIQNDSFFNGALKIRVTEQSYLFKFPEVENAVVDWSVVFSDVAGNASPNATGTFKTTMLSRRRALATNQTICRDNVTGASIPCTGTGLNGSWPDEPGPLLISSARQAGGTPTAQQMIAEDLQTGLIWSACGAGATYNGSQCDWIAPQTFYDSAKSCADMSNVGTTGYANLKGWRLPTLGELSSVTTFNGSPNLPLTSFPLANLGFYWAGTGSGSTNAYAMELDGSGGVYSISNNTLSVRALCVVDPNPSAPVPAFLDNADWS